MRVLAGPDTMLRWHRDLVTGRHAARSNTKRPGRPPAVRSIRALVLRLARDNPRVWVSARARRIACAGREGGALYGVGILKDAGLDPAPERPATTGAGFLRSQAAALLACDLAERSRGAGRASSCWLWPGTTRGGSGCRVTAHPAAWWVAHAPGTWSWIFRTPDARRGS